VLTHRERSDLIQRWPSGIEARLTPFVVAWIPGVQPTEMHKAKTQLRLVLDSVQGYILHHANMALEDHARRCTTEIYAHLATAQRQATATWPTTGAGHQSSGQTIAPDSTRQQQRNSTPQSSSAQPHAQQAATGTVSVAWQATCSSSGSWQQHSWQQRGSKTTHPSAATPLHALSDARQLRIGPQTWPRPVHHIFNDHGKMQGFQDNYLPLRGECLGPQGDGWSV